MGELTPDALFTCWSMARFLGGIKGRLDERGCPDGSDLPGAQRTRFKEVLGVTPIEFDEVWVAWASAPPAAAGK